MKRTPHTLSYDLPITWGSCHVGANRFDRKDPRPMDGYSVLGAARRENVVALPMRLRNKTQGIGAGSQGRENKILRLQQAHSNSKGENHPRSFWVGGDDARIQGLALHENSLQPKQQADVPYVRCTENYRVPEMEGFIRQFPDRHGSNSKTRNDVGQNQQRRHLRAVKLSMGGLRSARTESEASEPLEKIDYAGGG